MDDEDLMDQASKNVSSSNYNLTEPNLHEKKNLSITRPDRPKALNLNPRIIKSTEMYNSFRSPDIIVEQFFRKTIKDSIMDRTDSCSDISALRIKEF